jgi:coproporphyrinogen III oxidase-like Fe-S oxidoreductase
MSLRLFQGAEIVRIENLIEKPFDISYVQDLVDHGLIDVSNGFIQPLDNGRKLLNTLVSKIYDGLID